MRRSARAGAASSTVYSRSSATRSDLGTSGAFLTLSCATVAVRFSSRTFFFFAICGLPLFFLELTIGQFSNKSPLAVWEMAPGFKGMGMGMLMISFLLCIYYNQIIGWVFFYLFASFTSELPWSSCNNEWNTDTCIDNNPKGADSSNTTNSSVLLANTSVPSVAPYLINTTTKAAIKGLSAVEEFWTLRVLKKSSGIDNLDGLDWEVSLCVLLAWIVTFACLCRGVRSVGKVVYVTATVPYLFLTILLIRGATLPGAKKGIIYYVTPEWHRLKEFGIWGEACQQVFYSLGPAWGGVITMASFNKFNNNHMRDAGIVCLACSGTSFYGGFAVFAVLGALAEMKGVEVKDVLTAPGPGLAFQTYPAALAELPLAPFWSICFFLMLLSVGLDSMFATLETVIAGVCDEFPKKLGPRKFYVTLATCVVMYFGNLFFCTRAGIYIFQIFDWFSGAFCIMVIGLLEVIVIVLLYGVRQISYDIELMVGKPPSYWWWFCWCFATPIVLVIILVYGIWQWSEPTLGTYTYPGWAIGFGYMLSMLSIIPIPAYFIYKLITSEGTMKKRLYAMRKPNMHWAPADDKARLVWRYTGNRKRLPGEVQGHEELIVMKQDC